jgi:hypothetical protein
MWAEKGGRDMKRTKHWLDSILSPMFDYGFDCGLDYGCVEDQEVVTRTILDTILTRLPKEKVWDITMDETGHEVDAWNECLKAVKEALLEEKK